MARKKKFTIDKYNYGSYVIVNQQNPNAAIKGPSFGGSALSGAATGASALSSLGPMGTIAGGIIGAVGGLFGASNKERKARELRVDNMNRINNNFDSQFESLIDVTNNNPYGTYQDGGDVKKSFNPKLANKDKKFQDWYTKNTLEGKAGIPYSEDIAYDYFSFYKNDDYKNPNFNIESHFPDTYKRPNHPTFSNQSIYSTPDNPGGSWNGEQFIPNQGLKRAKFQMGGDVAPITQINIEKGELQVDPTNGKIIREYTGVNPETGGLYEPHAKKGKDSTNNIVTAEEGTFVITKDKAKEYKDAVDNNDKLHQNTIMHNIRNKKRQSMKFADGGLISPVDYVGITPATKLTTGPQTISGASLNVAQKPVINQTTSNINWGNIGNTAMNYLPSLVNLFQGMGSPNYINNSFSPTNPYKNQILANLPQDINNTPLLNRIYRDRNTAYGVINETTNSPAVARANKLNVMANTQRGIQDMYFQGEEYNNRARGQRAGIYDSLGQQELARFDSDRRYNFGVDMTNRQMAEGRRQQLNYGLSQLQQMYQNNRTNQQLQDRDSMRTRILEQIFPALLPYLDNIYGQGGTNGSR